MNIIFDTGNPDGPRMGIQTSAKQITWVTLPGVWHSTEEIMPTLLKQLRQVKCSLKDIEKIFVVPGPGSFTAVRAGVVWGNALAYALNIPLADLSRAATTTPLGPAVLKKLVRPVYGAEPNISLPKNF